MATSYHEIVSALRDLGLESTRPVIVHASLSAFGDLRGGAETLIGALLSSASAVLVPTFTYRAMLVPESGPDDNGIAYGSGGDANRMAEFFRPDLPADPLMGTLAETLRLQPRAKRSSHPLLSFAGLGAEAFLKSQTLTDPLAPIGMLSEQGGLAVLMGVDHTVNTSIHYAEKLAGRKQFVRWALTPEGVYECPGFPGCSMGFQAIAPHLEGFARQAQVGGAQVQAIPLPVLFATVKELLAEDPLALLCDSETCERCNAVRAASGQ